MNFGMDDKNNPFAKFWTDMAAQMMSPHAAPPSQADARDAMFRQMRQAFLDAWARSCDEFLSSDTFLETMKKSMDASLAFRQQMNEFFAKALHETQSPTRSDTDSILLVLHGLEDRLLARIEELSQRVAAIESGQPAPAERRTPSRGVEPVEPRPTPKKGVTR